MSFCSHETQQRDPDSEGKVRLAVSMETGDQSNDKAEEEARTQIHQMNRNHQISDKSWENEAINVVSGWRVVRKVAGNLVRTRGDL